jgi:Xaa-Pro aminopeptidase
MIKLLLTGLLILIIADCGNNSIEPVDNENSLEKLRPYIDSIDLIILKKRRDDLMKKVPANSMIIVTTNDVYLRNGDVDYEFRPASSFIYLIGFEEPDAIAIIRTKIPSALGSSVTSEMIMFVEQRSSTSVRWFGPCYGPEGAVQYFNADSAYGFDQFKSKMAYYLNTGQYTYLYGNLYTNKTVSDLFYASKSNMPVVNNLDGVLDELRVIKSSYEINFIQKSTDISVQAFTKVMKEIKPGMYEYEVDALLNYILRLNGCSRSAFPAIVASGPNINTIHYIANNRQMQNGDLVMIDYGAEYGYYASDLTRTLPVNGEFSAEQKILYGIVLETYKTVINNAKPGVKYSELSSNNTSIIIDRLLEKGIISGNKSTIISTGVYTNYIPAGLGHCVGLDVHDPFPISNNPSWVLKENMVFAFEPHVYLLEGDYTVNPIYWNISARIENTVLITGTGNRVLSNNLPIEITEIEQLMKQE